LAICPACHSEIEITSQHYGTLFTCPKCSGVFFVDWGGQPEVPGEEPVTGNTPVYSEAPVEEEIQNLDTHYEPTPLPMMAGSSDFQIENPEPEQYPEQEMEAPILSDDEASPYDFAQPLGQIQTPVQDPTEPTTSDSSDLSDIADFGNADLGQAAFNYTLTISGIDSGVLRAQIQEAITDTKFGWNVIQMMTQIKGGVLTIRSVNAVKASILMQRVKYLPVKISWRQDVLSSTV